MKHVIAGNYQQFKLYLRLTQQREYTDALYVGSIRDLTAIASATIVKLETHMDSPLYKDHICDANDLIAHLCAHNNCTVENYSLDEHVRQHNN